MSLTPAKLLGMVGIEHQEKSNRLQLLCPFHDDTNPSAGFYLDTERFYCFTCDLSLDLVGFYAKLKGILPSVARNELEKTTGVRLKRKNVSPEYVRFQRVATDKILVSLKDRFTCKEFGILEEQLDQILDQIGKGELDEETGDALVQDWYKMVGTLV